MGWISSPFPAHPRDEVRQEINIRNPGINLTGLSDWELVDLYLRFDYSTSYSEEIMKMRDYFGFNPDLYVETSSRDTIMQNTTRTYIDAFIQSLPLKDDCYTKMLALEWWQVPFQSQQGPYNKMERTVRAYLIH